MQSKKLARIVNHYSRLLGLRHWDIRVALVGPEALVGDDGSLAQGQVTVHSQLLRADIQLLNPELVTCPKIRSELDLRATLLHELIHILLEPLEIPENKLDNYEQAVISLERGIRTLEGRLQDAKRQLKILHSGRHKRRS